MTVTSAASASPSAAVNASTAGWAGITAAS